MLVEEIMSPSPALVDISASVRDVLDTFLALDIRYAPVVSNGEYMGVVSERELKEFIYPLTGSVEHEAKHRSATQTKVREVLCADFPMVHPDMELVALIDLLLTREASMIPVVDKTSGELCGVVTLMDVIKAARTLFDD